MVNLRTATIAAAPPARAVLVTVLMHPLLFSFKRVFLRSTYFTRAFAREFDLTPARYDLLIAIARSPDGIAQKDLRHVIGVTAPVICRMLYRLEELGLVWRHPHPSTAAGAGCASRPAAPPSTPSPTRS